MSNTETDLAKERAQIFIHAPGLEPGLRHSLALANPDLVAYFVSGLDDPVIAAGQGPVLLVRPEPVAILADFLAQTGDQARAVAAWTKDTEAFVRLTATLRRRLLLADRAGFVAGDPVLHQALADRLGFSLLYPGWMAQAPAIPVSAQMVVMAHALIYCDNRLLSQVRQIEALTQPSAGAANNLSDAVSAALAGVDTGHPLSAQVGQPQANVSERALLRGALASLLAETDGYPETIAAAQAAHAEVQDALAERDVLVADLAALQHRQAAAEKDRLHREDVMGTVILDLGRQIDALTDAGHRDAERVTALQAELDRVLRSKSWRVTAPLRATRRAMGGSD